MYPACFRQLLWELLFRKTSLSPLPVEDTQGSSHWKAISSNLNVNVKSLLKAHSVLKPRSCGSDYSRYTYKGMLVLVHTQVPVKITKQKRKQGRARGKVN